MSNKFNGSVKKAGLMGRKIAMSQIFDENGNVIPVTVVELGPCFVTQIKSEANDGYNALQLGFQEMREVLVGKAKMGLFKKMNLKPFRFLKEFRGFDVSGYNVGDRINADLFEENEKVHVTGLSKGKGYAGSHKRHGFGGGRKTHGSHFHRAPGSIGACATPAKVFKGARMPGKKGSDRVTLRNLKIVRMDKEKNQVLVSGALPGKMNDLVVIIKS